jgi:hypothetical protein
MSDTSSVCISLKDPRHHNSLEVDEVVSMYLTEGEQWFFAKDDPRDVTDAAVELALYATDPDRFLQRYTWQPLKRDGLGRVFLVRVPENEQGSIVDPELCPSHMDLFDIGLENLLALDGVLKGLLGGLSRDEAFPIIGEAAPFEWERMLLHEIPTSFTRRVAQLPTNRVRHVSRLWLRTDYFPSGYWVMKLVNLVVAELKEFFTNAMQEGELVLACSFVTPPRAFPSPSPVALDIEDELFGSLTWDTQFEQYWRGEVELPSLDGYHVRWSMSPDNFDEFRLDSYTRKAGGKNLSMSVNDPFGNGPTPAQRAAMIWLVEDEANILQRIMRAVVNHARNGDYDDVFESEYLPDDERELREQILSRIDQPGGLRELIALDDLTVNRRERDAFSYLTFFFKIGWDEEHGACAVVHQDRIVDIGEVGSLYDFDDAGGYEGEGRCVCIDRTPPLLRQEQ